MSNVSIAELSRSLQCSLERAAAIKLKAAEIALPYLHARISAMDVVLTRAGNPAGGLATRQAGWQPGRRAGGAG